MRKFRNSIDSLCAAALLATSLAAYAESPELTATYLGNEGVMLAQGGVKVVFDPLYQNTYGTYQAVPPEIRAALLSAAPPFDNLQALFISHAHGDHFSAEDVATFIRAHDDAFVVAPAPAIDALTEVLKLAGDPVPTQRFVRIALEYGAQPLEVQVGSLRVEAVRIAHAGGADRRDIENIVYRVALADETVVMHMGDADPRLSHYLPYKAYWQAQRTDVAFPPYWMLTAPGGKELLEDRLNTARQIGVHVPAAVPEDLRASGADYFSKPGEQRVLRVVKEEEPIEQAGE